MVEALPEGHRWAPALIGAALAVTWAAWMVGAEVAVREATPVGRVELVSQAAAVEAPVGGQVVRSALKLGATVAAGDVLMELDAADLSAGLEAERAALDGVRGQADAVRALATARAGEAELAAAARAVDEAEQVAKAARSAEQLARAERDRAAAVQASGALSVADGEVAQDAWRRADAARLAADAALAQRQAERDALLANVDSRAARVRGELAALEGAAAAGEARVAGAEQRLARSTVRAPIPGVLAEIASVGPGDVVSPGERLATIVPAGDLQVVASFPVEALGRIQPGQQGRMRALAFDWTRYGAVPLEVTAVAGVERYGAVRVELRVAGPTDVPLAHGLVGDVEVEVERTSPWSLLARAVGAVARPAR